MADYGFFRLPASAATGALTFSRYTSGAQVLIPAGTQAKTSDGSLSFAVAADPANPAWDGINNYVLGAGVAQVTVAAEAIAAGAASNVAAGSITLIAAQLPGIDYVFNALAFGGGVDAESDIAFRARFQLYINSRSAATYTAISAAIYGVQQGIRLSIVENANSMGLFSPGNFCIIADNGSGTLGGPLATAISSAIEAVRPVGSTYSIQAPAQLPVTVSFSILAPGENDIPAIVQAAVGAISKWVSGLPIGGTLAISRLESLVHGTSSSIVSVVNMTLNSGNSDITASWNEVFIVTTVAGS
jgi:uncharacterized phage protein gp47/JayE